MKLRWEHPLWRRWGPVLVSGMVKGWLHTCPISLAGSAAARDLIAARAPILFTSWHCHLLAPLYYFRHWRGALMLSPSRDGEFMGEVFRRWGYGIDLGSGGKGGARALRRLKDYLVRGESLGIVADGSRGPARVVQKGVIFLAREAQAPIIPLAVASRRKITFQTWDRFELPLPFSPLTLLAGAPVRVPPGAKGASQESCRLTLESSLRHLYQQSQAYFSPEKNFA